jgi:transcriptional regulator with XRE-family HTH domain
VVLLAKMNEELKTRKPLKDLIEQAGYSQKEFASVTGLAYSAVRYYISGERSPSVHALSSMCKALNKSPKSVMSALGIDTTGIPDDRPPE